MVEHYKIKTWELSGYLTGLDVEYIQACSIKFVSGKTSRSQPATVVTGSVDQESALVLKYSGRLQLINSVQVSTASFCC